jgi:hypothetical protein
VDSAARWFLAGIIVSLVNTALVIAFIGIPGITDDDESNSGDAEPIVVTETEVVEVEVPVTYILVVDEDGNIVREEVRVGRPGEPGATATPRPGGTPDPDDLEFGEARFASVFNPLQVAANSGLALVANGGFGLTAIDLNGGSAPVVFNGLQNTGSSAAIDVDITFDGTIYALLRDSSSAWRIARRAPSGGFWEVVASAELFELPAEVNALSVSATGKVYLSASQPAGLFEIDLIEGTLTAVVEGQEVAGVDAGLVGARIAYAAPMMRPQAAGDQVQLLEEGVTSVFRTTYGRCTGPVALPMPGSPSDVAQLVDDGLLIADEANHSVYLQQRNGSGELIFGRRDCAPGSDESSLDSPSGVAIDRDRNIFIADRGNNRVIILPRASDESAGAEGGDASTEGAATATAAP